MTEPADRLAPLSDEEIETLLRAVHAENRDKLQQVSEETVAFVRSLIDRIRAKKILLCREVSVLDGPEAKGGRPGREEHSDARLAKSQISLGNHGDR